MKNLFCITGVFLFICFFQSKIIAQPSLGFSDYWQGDTVYAVIGDTVQLEFFIENKGNQVFSGDIGINSLYNNVLGTNFMLTNQNVQNLHPHDSVDFQVDVDLNLIQFQVGWNIIVIWPQSIYAPADSATVVVHLEPYLSSELPEKKDEITVFIENKTLFIHYGKIENNVESVSIYTLSGQKILHQNHSPDKISVKQFAQGVYILNIQLNDGNRIVKKVWVE